MAGEQRNRNWERNRSVAAHLCGLLIMLAALPIWQKGLFLGVPLLHVFAAWLLWRSARQQGFFIDAHGCTSLNFQSTLAVVLAIVAVIGYGAGLWLPQARFWTAIVVTAIVLLGVVYSVWGALRAYDRKSFKYLLAYPFFKTQF